MNEEMLIVPTQELAFAVKKDGSIISNFTEKRGGVEEVDVKALTAYFKGLHTFIKTCDEKVLMAYAFVDLLESKDIHQEIIKRMETIKDKHNE